MLDSRFNESAWVLRANGNAMTSNEVCSTVNTQLGRTWSEPDIARALDELVRNALASRDRTGRYKWIVR